MVFDRWTFAGTLSAAAVCRGFPANAVGTVGFSTTAVGPMATAGPVATAGPAGLLIVGGPTTLFTAVFGGVALLSLVTALSFLFQKEKKFLMRQKLIYVTQYNH